MRRAKIRIDNDIAYPVLNILRRNGGFINSAEIEMVLNMGGATVRGCIHYLRESGHPVISTGMGYKYTTNKKEIKSCIKSLLQRASKIQCAAYALDDTLDAMV
jgi:hypothetical protein